MEVFFDDKTYKKYNCSIFFSLEIYILVIIKRKKVSRHSRKAKDSSNTDVYILKNTSWFLHLHQRNGMWLVYGRDQEVQ